MSSARDIAHHLFWTAVMLIVTGYAFVLIVHTQAAASVLQLRPILVRDAVYPGVHQLSGSIEVPLSCDELISHVEKVSDTSFRIIFETWQNPSLICYRAQTSRDFQIVAFAPSTGISFAATLDGKPLRIAVVESRTQ